jgi:hypothetical protein
MDSHDGFLVASPVGGGDNDGGGGGGGVGHRLGWQTTCLGEA